MQRRGHTGRAHYRPAGPSETRKIKSLRDLIFLFGNFLIRIESASHFSYFSNFLEGRLPPENGSDWAENLTRSVSDESAKNIFLARTKKSGCHFSNFPSILGFFQFERFDIFGFLQFDRSDIWASCSSSVLTFGLFAVRPF